MQKDIRDYEIALADFNARRALENVAGSLSGTLGCISGGRLMGAANRNADEIILSYLETALDALDKKDGPRIARSFIEQVIEALKLKQRMEDGQN